MESKSITCPNCGGNLTVDAKKCPYCKQPVIITSIDSISSFTPLQTNKYISSYQKSVAQDPANKEVRCSLALCYLKLKLYDRAIAEFEKAMVDNYDSSEVYFYAAISLLKGKKAFLTPRPVIDKIEEYIQAALMIEPKAIYYYFWAYVRYDHHYRKSYRMSPNYSELLTEARQLGLSVADVTFLYSVLGVDRPETL